jgi:hypothetical protein
MVNVEFLILNKGGNRRRMKSARACVKVKIKNGSGRPEAGGPVLPHPCPLPLVEGESSSDGFDVDVQFAPIRAIRVKGLALQGFPRPIKAIQTYSRGFGGKYFLFL